MPARWAGWGTMALGTLAPHSAAASPPAHCRTTGWGLGSGPAPMDALTGPHPPVSACPYPCLPILMGTSVPRATSPRPQCPTYLRPRCPTRGQQPRGSPLTAGGQGAAPGASSRGWRRGPRGHLAAGGRGQGHLPPSEDAPGPAAGNFPSTGCSQAGEERGCPLSS